MPRFAACAPQKYIIRSGGAIHVAPPLLLFHIGMTMLSFELSGEFAKAYKGKLCVP